jgi:two-component system sensor histidine kinase FlrB
VVKTTGIAEHTELANGRFINVSRRDLRGGQVVLLTDVTESHVMQLALHRQQRLLTMGELAAGLAHQIRTPLATALLYASQMTLPDRSGADLARCAERTVGSLKQLDSLVNDMLAFAHGGAARERVSVSALLEQVAQWLRPALRHGVRLTIRTQAPDLMIRANAPSLVSAILNLATNALQAAPADLHLELLARRGAGGRAQIVVSDDGPGVPEALRERIFEPFFTTRARGNGIGLAIVRSVVEAHRGGVSLADSARGATFVIDLPAEETS